MTDQTQPTTPPQPERKAAALPLAMTLGDLQMQSAWQAWAEATSRANDAARTAIALKAALQPFANAYAEWLALTGGNILIPVDMMITHDDLARAYEALYGGGQ